MTATVVFDLGGVLLAHDPVQAFVQVMPPEEVAGFMAEIDYPTWHHHHDAGRSFADGLAELRRTHPDHAERAAALGEHFQHTLTGYVPGTGAVVAELEQAGVRLLALTNFPSEPWPGTLERFGILRRFEQILVSGDEQLAKPDPAIFALLLSRWSVDPATAVFVDDRADNCAAAESVGITGAVFTDADDLRDRLVARGLLGPRTTVPGPIHHLALRTDWDEALRTGRYRWSTRGVTVEAEGYTHCSRPDQVAATRERFYADVADEELVLLTADPARLSSPVVVEPAGDDTFPHVFGELEPAEVGATPYR